MNTQTAQSIAVNELFVRIHSIWHTLQGEGPYCGRPAIFIRVFGCNLQCPTCDTDYTSICRSLTPKQIVAEALSCSGPWRKPELAVITGGEPFRQNLVPLLTELGKHFQEVQIETNGTLPIRKSLTCREIIVCSPKGKKVHPDFDIELDVLWKYVLKAGEIDWNDGLPTKAMGYNHPPARPPAKVKPHEVFIQPLDESDETLNKNNNHICKEVSLQFGYRMNLQLHKYLGLK